MRALAFDTETTGVNTDVIHKLALTNSYPVQLAAYLFDTDLIGDTWELGKAFPQGMLSCYLNYDVESDPKALEVHRITKAMAQLYGISPLEALPVFAEMLDTADVLVGHNLKFDMDILSIAFARAGWEGEPFKGRSVFDTMDSSRDICKLLKPRMKHPEDWKSPKLIEAYRHFFGREFKGAHGASADTLAAFDIYLALSGRTPIMEPTSLEKVNEVLGDS